MVGEQTLLNHGVSHILEDANHPFEILICTLVFRRAVLSVLFRKIFDAIAINVERHPGMEALQAALIRIAASKLLAYEHVRVPAVVRPRNM